jgi:hypothetical protein
LFQHEVQYFSLEFCFHSTEVQKALEKTRKSKSKEGTLQKKAKKDKKKKSNREAESSGSSQGESPQVLSGIDKMRERASAARTHLLNFCRHILKY